MAKRKSDEQPLEPMNKNPKLKTAFGCPFCCNSSSVECTLDELLMIGVVACSSCFVMFRGKITPLTAPEDLFNEWINKCMRRRQKS